MSGPVRVPSRRSFARTVKAQHDELATFAAQNAQLKEMLNRTIAAFQHERYERPLFSIAYGRVRARCLAIKRYVTQATA